MKVFIGWDPRDALAYEVCAQSLVDHATIDVNIIPLKEWDLRRKGIFWRAYSVGAAPPWAGSPDQDKWPNQHWDWKDGKPFSTLFSFSRFAVPILMDYADEWVLWMDPDMLWRADIKELWESFDRTVALNCIQHQHRPPEGMKMDGVRQQHYARKNWSSLMILNPARCQAMTPYLLNNQTGSYLHGLFWLADHQIGSLEQKWNWLCGWSDDSIDPAIVHFTRGTPDMEGHEKEPYADEWWDVAAHSRHGWFLSG